MSLELRLNKKRIPITDIDLSLVTVMNADDANEIQGRIAETLVFTRLSEIGANFDMEFPKEHNGHKWIKTKNGVVVMSENETIHEYDFLVSYGGMRYIVEVKSFRLNGIESKIPRAIELASEYYSEPVRFILVFPFYCNKQKDAQRLEEKNPAIRCVDSGYKKKQLHHAVERYIKYAKTLIGIKNNSINL